MNLAADRVDAKPNPKVLQSISRQRRSVRVSSIQHHGVHGVGGQQDRGGHGSHRVLAAGNWNNPLSGQQPHRGLETHNATHCRWAGHGSIGFGSQCDLNQSRPHRRAPLPELEPQAVQNGSNGLVVSPPTELQPLEEEVDRKLAHSERFVFPTMMAPAFRNRATTGASFEATLLINASEPAVVAMPFRWMLSLMTIACP